MSQTTIYYCDRCGAVVTPPTPRVLPNQPRYGLVQPVIIRKSYRPASGGVPPQLPAAGEGAPEGGPWIRSPLQVMRMCSDGYDATDLCDNCLRDLEEFWVAKRAVLPGRPKESTT